MKLSMIAAPIIGALIGYATNYIAVKMLFRPLKPIKIGNKTLPFTPGIIPKGKPRLAHAIGEVVGTNLLSKDALKQTLLNDSMKDTFRTSINDVLIRTEQEERSVQSLVTTVVSEETVDQNKEKLVEYLSTRIEYQLTEHPIGDMIAEEVTKAVKENLHGGLIGMFVNDSLLASVGAKISDGVNAYLANHSKELVQPMITEECEHVLEMPVCDLAGKMEEHNDEISKAILSIYESVIENKIDKILDQINIPKVVEDQINGMDMLELEHLILSVMKKELNALVNLGALIGFILGLLNLLF